MADLLDELSLINYQLSDHIKENFNISYPQGIISLGYWIDLNKPTFEEILNKIFLKKDVIIIIDDEYTKNFKNPTFFDIFLYFNQYIEETNSHAVFFEFLDENKNNTYFLFAGS